MLASDSFFTFSLGQQLLSPRSTLMLPLLLLQTLLLFLLEALQPLPLCTFSLSSLGSFSRETLLTFFLLAL